MLPSFQSLPSCGLLLRAALAYSGSYRASSGFAIQNKALKAGPGGRSSVSGVTATVFGGNGFIGKYVVDLLAKQGSQVVCPFRCSEENAMPLKQMGDLGQIVLLKDFNLKDEEFVKHALSRSNVVVNLIGSKRETHNYTYEDVNADWPERLAGLVAANSNIERFIHFSCLGADVNHTSRRLKTKGVGDDAVSKICPAATIIRPAPVVGDEDDFFNNFVWQCKYGVAVPLVDGGRTKVQPTYVVDVMEALKKIFADQSTAGQTYYLGGPEVITIKEIVSLMYTTLLEEEETLYMPSWFAKLWYKRADILNRMTADMAGNTMFTADYIEELSRDKVVPSGVLGYGDLAVLPQKVTEGLPIELIRHCRVGGYRLGDTRGISKNLPVHVRKFFGMDTLEKNPY